EWASIPPPRRAEYLLKFADILTRRKWDLAREMTREMGKVIQESGGDVQEAIDTAQYIFGEGHRMFGVVTASELRDKWAMAYRRPVGVCAIITPWNFPSDIPIWKIAPALLCGNTIVFKPSRETPKLATLLVQAFEEISLPPGVLNLVHGSGEAVGETLIAHPDVRLISFTGSVETGKHIAEVAGRTLKKVSLEMGGKNPVIVLDDADEELVIEGVRWGAFGTTGQRCTATSRLIVQKRIAHSLLPELTARTRKLRLGNGLAPSTEVGPIINSTQLEKIDRYVHIGRKEGARLVTGGKIIKDGDYSTGYFYAPTIFTGVTPKMTIFQEEIFGPVLAVTSVTTFEEAVRIANGVRFGFSSSIYTRDVEKAFRAMNQLESGMTYVNAPTIGAEVHLPFGGVKETGNGHREGAAWTLLAVFSEWKTVYVDYSGKLQKAQNIDTEVAVQS
ncbi:MAG: aldehyde dehydrogenase family protein, partial [bacterium]